MGRRPSFSGAPSRSCFLLLALLAAPGRADDAIVAAIAISSATSGSNLGERLVEGVMSFRGNDYLLTLRGVAESSRARGEVRGLLKARDIEGVFKPEGQDLRSASGVTIRFDPPLVLAAGKLEIELLVRRQPKQSSGHRESGVD